MPVEVDPFRRQRGVKHCLAQKLNSSSFLDLVLFSRPLLAILPFYAVVAKLEHAFDNYHNMVSEAQKLLHGCVMTLDVVSVPRQHEPARERLHARIIATICKLILCLSGLWLLYVTSGTLSAPVLLSCSLLIGGVIVYFVARTTSTAGRVFFGRFTVPAAFVLLVTLNVTGWIGTLTGSNPASSYRNLSLVAAPFYFLSIAAVISDVATGRIRAPNFLNFATYVLLPFKLLAGPLEPPSFFTQLENWKPRLSVVRLTAGWPWLVLGAVMKFVIGNHLTPANTLDNTHPLVAVATAASFELKFYFDFAGYSFIGYSLAIFTGLRINRNFSHPFFARNVVLFWRRWHMSLGRFLARYLLEPNVTKIKNRRYRMIFTSSIFLVSAMWHGGTANYALWGIFHGACYFLWISRAKHWKLPRPIGILAIISFFIFGRLIAIDADWRRLVQKIINILNPMAWRGDFLNISAVGSDIYLQYKSLLLAASFLLFEGLSIKYYGSGRPYHLFRRPYVALMLLIFVLLFAKDGGGLLYARL